MVLQEIPSAFKQKRPVATAESLYHMVACITHYVAKVISVVVTLITCFIRLIHLCQTNPKYTGVLLHTITHSTQFQCLPNPVT